MFQRTELVDFARKRFERQSQVAGGSADELKMAKNILDPETLTLGFARRFVPYKRPNLLLSDPARFINILTNAATTCATDNSRKGAAV